jgi:ATP-dependent DNA ligase
LRPFEALHRHSTVSEAMLYAFDLLEIDGEDLRPLPLFDRKWRLAKLIGRRRVGIGAFFASDWTVARALFRMFITRSRSAMP